MDDLILITIDGLFFQWSPAGRARGTSMFFGGIRRSIPSYAQGFGGLSYPHSCAAIGRGLLRGRTNTTKGFPVDSLPNGTVIFQRRSQIKMTYFCAHWLSSRMSQFIPFVLSISFWRLSTFSDNSAIVFLCI